MALYFTSLEAIKNLIISQENQNLGPMQALLLGASARSISGTLLMPFTVIKTRFEVQPMKTRLTSISYNFLRYF